MSDRSDHVDRYRAVQERERNVIVEASAGTGKTALVVDRLLALLAPSDGNTPVPIERIAAITFTRKAAGELAARVRQRILTELAEAEPGTLRAKALTRALAGLDTSYIGTIHGFANRLLRKWPAEARLDPRYLLDEDEARTVHESFARLLRAADERTLGELESGALGAARVEEAATALADARRAGLLEWSMIGDHWTKHGLDALIEGFALHRDRPVPEVEVEELDRTALEAYAQELGERTLGLSTSTRGGRWLLEMNEVVQRALLEPDPVVIYGEVVAPLERGPAGSRSATTQKHDFPGDARGWDVWKALDGDKRQHPIRDRPLRDDLLAPLRRWLAIRLLRARPVALHVYERVQASKQVVDHVDLLLRLRDLLRDDRSIRRRCQALFDHVFVDEFQDTDPLQAEIVLYLCEAGAEAASWDEVRVAPGRLTVVGDPKQSIFRFRRADLETYQRVLEVIQRSPVLTVRLASSYRSTPSLVGWLNQRFEEILGPVLHQPLAVGRADGASTSVHTLGIAAGGNADEGREREAAALARYVRWLVRHGDPRIVEPRTRELRRPRYGEIGVLAMTTTNLPLLFAAFDRDRVPYAARGGSLFASDPLHRQFLLGLCALADSDDGVAMAALLRPPFFALDLSDLARSRRDDPEDRAVRARSIVRGLRLRRFQRGPGATARALLHESGFGRTVALGPNGAQRLGQLRELCFQIERRAAREQLDFAAVVDQLRDWIDHPPALDPPHPITDDAVRVMTVHQAKGLEFPVVALWDSRATWQGHPTSDAFLVSRDGHDWAMRLENLRWEEPGAAGLDERERALQDAERRRLLYVAATRARDILVIPKVRVAGNPTILNTLLGTATSPAVIERPAHTEEAPAAWYTLAAPEPELAPAELEITARDVELQRAWNDAAAIASTPQHRPRSFAGGGSSRERWDREERHGPRFGEAVHLALGLVLRSSCSAAEAVRRAMTRMHLEGHFDDALGDVGRAIASLGALGVTSAASGIHVEYPVSGLSASGDLVSGYIDLVAFREDAILVIDFKTDAVPSTHPIPPAYREQVLGYAAALGSLLESTERVRAGLLYTADGGVRWLTDSGSNDGAE